MAGHLDFLDIVLLQPAELFHETSSTSTSLFSLSEPAQSSPSITVLHLVHHANRPGVPSLFLPVFLSIFLLQILPVSPTFLSHIKFEEF